MLKCFTDNVKQAIPLIPLQAEQLPTWLKTQTESIQRWVAQQQFTAKPDTYCLLPDQSGNVACVLCGIENINELWNLANLVNLLPTYEYILKGDVNLTRLALAWGLAAYQFSHYKPANVKPVAKLFLPNEQGYQAIQQQIEALYWVRDLINTPANDMGPEQLALAAADLAKQHGAKFQQIIGEELLKQNYPAIYAVGKASIRQPRLVELTWGNKSHPQVVLLGKGVCFDTGGLNIKPMSGMALMRKDMAGAAHALGLARLIMEAHLPIYLRVLIPAVENAISGNAYRPGDIINTRKGLHIEINNTDAEGRVILADALTEAAANQPSLILDFATLTGAARIALGADITALFTPDDLLAEQLQHWGRLEQDPIWRMPLYAAYRKHLDTPFADIANSSSQPYGGAITAALFLQEFVPKKIEWAHFDLMAWNIASRPGRPEGGEAMAIRAVFSYLQKRFAN